MFSRQEGFLSLLFNSINSTLKVVETFIIYKFYLLSNYLFNFFLYCIDLKLIEDLSSTRTYKWYSLSDIASLMFYFVLSFFLKVISIIFGFNLNNSLSYLNDKYSWNGLKFLNNLSILRGSHSDLMTDFFSWNLSEKSIAYLTNEKYLSYSLYHYGSLGFFYNGLVNNYNYWSRLLSSKHINTYFLNNSETTLLVDKNNFILRDTFFESQDFKHSMTFEFIWAVFPTTIILALLVPSLYLLYSLDDTLDPQFTVKVIGHQWYWSYEFRNYVYWPCFKDKGPAFEGMEFLLAKFEYDSNIVQTSDLDFGTKRLLEVDNRLVVPTNATLRFLVTSVMCFMIELYLN